MNKLNQILRLVPAVLCCCLFLPNKVKAQNYVTTSSMNVSRAMHTATLLQNGQVLVVGGFTNDRNTPTSSAELFTPATGAWTNTTGSLAGLPTSEHTATLLPSGKVLIAGGLQSASPSPFYFIYDPSSQAFTSGFMGNNRRGHTATLLPGGTVLICGGNNNFPELFDGSIWTTTAGNLNFGRFNHTATFLPSGKVLVAGGGQPISELYDPITGLWTTNGVMRENRVGHTATLLPSGKVLVVGGSVGLNSPTTPTNTAELYDPATGTWAVTGSMVNPRRYHTATLLPNGKVFVSGGWNLGFITYGEIYNPATGTWTTDATYSPRRFAGTATLLTNGKVLLAGGDSDSSLLTPALSTAEIYEPYSAPALNVGLKKYIGVDSSSLQVGTNYQVQVSSDLTHWTNNGAPFTATSASWNSTNHWQVENWNKLYFRLQQQ
jgi:hypothetical protein